MSELGRLMVLLQQRTQGRAIPKEVMTVVLTHPSYKPIPIEACECAVPKKGSSGILDITWKRCVLLGQINGGVPINHVRIANGDYFTGVLGLRACERPK